MPRRLPTDSMRSQGSQGDSGFTFGSAVQGVKDFASGIVGPEGVQQDPFVSVLLKELGAIEGASPEGLAEIARVSKGSTATQVGNFVGEHGAGLLFGIGAYSGGFLASRVAIQAAAKKIGLQAAARTALGSAARSSAKEASKKGFRGQVDRVVRKAGDRAGVAPQIQGTPGLQAVGERAGAGLGIGAFVGAQEKARGKSDSEALKSAAIATAFSFGIDSALVGGSRLLFRGARSVDLAAHREAFITKTTQGLTRRQLKKHPEGLSPKERIEGTISAQDSKIKGINGELRKVLKTGQQQGELEFEQGLSLPARLRAILNPASVNSNERGLQRIVQRFEKGEIDFNKPQGLFTTPANVKSPHSSLGKKHLFERAEQNPLNVSGSKTILVKSSPNRRTPGGRGVEASAGIKAAEKLAPKSVFDSLVNGNRKQVLEILNREFPAVNWGRFKDTYEMIEGYSGMLARRRGFDAIIDIDRVAPEFSEFIALKQSALKPVTEAQVFKGVRKEATRVQNLLRTKKATKTTRKQFQEILANEGTAPYIGQGPGTYVGPIGRMLDKMDPTGRFRLNFFSAPEAHFGALGSAANRFLSPLKAALTRSGAEERIAESVFSTWSETLRRAAGVKSGVWKKGFGRNLDLAHAWESGGEEGVRKIMLGWGRTNKQAEQAVAVWKARTKSDWQLFQVRGRHVGGKPPADLKELGVAQWITHGSRDIDEATLIKEMVATKKFTELEAREIVRSRGSHLDPDLVNFEGVRTNGAVRNGPLDFNRLQTGTTKEKILGRFNETTGKMDGGGLPMNPNVWDSGFQAQRAAIRRVNTDPILGGAVNTKKGRIMGGTLDDMVATVEAEGHNGAKFRSVVDAMVGRTYYNESMRKWATALTSLQVAAKLPMAVLANASQPTLTTTWLGIKPSLKGALALTSKVRREEFTQAMAIHEHIIKGIGRSMDDEGITLTSLEKVADLTLRFTGFNRVERFNRIHGAAATQVMIRDRLARGMNDKLRGTSLDTTRKMFGEIGLNFDVLVRDVREMGPEAFFKSSKFLKMESNALIQGAQKTQFFPGPTRTPAMWRHPLARTLLQFKTFAVGQSRFIRDAVLTEYSHGNMAPLATYLSMAPIAGELVGDGRAIINGKDRTENGIARGLDNITYVGGLGLFTDVLGQARWGNLESVLLGPTFGNLFDIAEALATGEMAGIRRLGQNQPAYKMSRFLVGRSVETTEEILEYLDSIGSEGGPPVIIDLGERLTDRVHNKRR